VSNSFARPDADTRRLVTGPYLVWLSLLFVLTTVDARAQTAATASSCFVPRRRSSRHRRGHNLIVVRQLDGQDLFVVTQGLAVAPL